MMKSKKIGFSILSMVLTLSMLLSAVAGLGLTSAAETSTEPQWDYTYAVTPATETVENGNYYNAALMDGIDKDFAFYAWDAAGSDYSEVLSLKTVYSPYVNEHTVRQNANTAIGYRNAGYLDLQHATATVPAAMTHKAEVADFYLEVDVVISASWGLSKGIMIAPAGEFALVNSATVADKGVYIPLMRGQAGLGGAIDPDTAATLSTVSTTADAGGCFAAAPMLNEENRVRAGLYTFTNDTSLQAVTDNTQNDLVTYCVQVYDGVISVWTKDDTTKILSAKLTDDYVGGQISFVSTSQNYNAFAGMRLQELAPCKEWNYEVTRNTTTGTYVEESLGDIVDDFMVYKWNVAADTTDNIAVYGAPTLETGYPLAVSAETVTQVNDNANKYGYLNFYGYSGTSYKDYAMALTHKKVFEKNDDFALEMDVMINNWQQNRGIMIAKPGVFAITNDENAANDTGVSIVFNRGGKIEIGGAIVTESGATAASSYIPTKYAVSSAQVSIATATNVADVASNAYKLTICVTVKDGVLSVWNKNAPEKRQTVCLSDAYAGGSVSFVGTEGSERNELVGMRLTETTGEWDYAVTQNTGDADYTLADFADIAADFKVYNWNVAASGENVAYYAPTLTSGYPVAVDTTTVEVTPYSSTSNRQARNFGYMDFPAIASNTASALTHRKTLAAGDEFLLEMDLVVRKGYYTASKGIMIAPAGSFAVSNDGNASNDGGIYISFDAGYNFAVTGAVETTDASTTSTNTITHTWAQQPFVNASNVINFDYWGTPVGELSCTVVSGETETPYTADLVTICVELRNGIMTVWEKADPDNVMAFELGDAYAGGNISFVSNSVWDHAFAGMRLTEYAPMEAGTAAVNKETGIITVKGVNGKELKAGSLTVTDNGKNVHIPTRVGYRTNGQTALYRVLNTDGAVVTNFESNDVTMQFTEPTLDAPNIGNVGTSYNSEKVGLRFVSRFARTQDAATGVEYVVTADGVKYEITDYGMLMSSAPGLATTDLSVDEDMQVGSSNRYVVKLSVKEANKYYDLSNAYVDMAVTIVNIDALEEAGYDAPEQMELYARAYVTVKVSDTETRTLYGSVFSCAYADVYAAQ